MSALRIPAASREAGAFLDAGDAARRLLRGIPCLMNDEWRIEDASLGRVDVRGNGDRVLAFALRLRHAATGRIETRPAFVETAPPDEERVPDGALGPFGPVRRLVGRDRESGARMWLSPADPRILHAFDVLAGERLDGAEADGAWGVRILGHRFGRRLSCLLTRCGAGRADFILKVHAGRVERRATSFLRRVGARAGGFRVPRVVIEDPSTRFVLLERMPGASVHELLPGGTPLPMRVLGRAMRELQSVATTGLPRHGAAEERATVEKLARRAAAVDPVLADGVLRELNGAARALADDAESVTSHRDLHDKQVLCAERSLALIDWDLVAAAPAPLDPANFLAHLTLRALQGRVSEPRARAERAAFTDGYGPSSTAWERIALLRLASVYALRPAWPGLAGRLLEAAGSCKE